MAENSVSRVRPLPGWALQQVQNGSLRYRATGVDSRSRGAKAQSLRGAKYDIHGNVTEGTDVTTGKPVTLTGGPTNIDRFKQTNQLPGAFAGAPVSGPVASGDSLTPSLDQHQANQRNPMKTSWGESWGDAVETARVRENRATRDSGTRVQNLQKFQTARSKIRANPFANAPKMFTPGEDGKVRVHGQSGYGTITSEVAPSVAAGIRRTAFDAATPRQKAAIKGARYSS